jgi:hypothetical protein
MDGSMRYTQSVIVKQPGFSLLASALLNLHLTPPIISRFCLTAKPPRDLPAKLACNKHDVWPAPERNARKCGHSHAKQT